MMGGVVQGIKARAHVTIGKAVLISNTSHFQNVNVDPLGSARKMLLIIGVAKDTVSAYLSIKNISMKTEYKKDKTEASH